MIVCLRRVRSRQNRRNIQAQERELLPLFATTAKEPMTIYHFGHAAENLYIQEGLLHRKSKDAWGEPGDQLVVPSKYRLQLIALAHETPSSILRRSS
jgi:hypothetical protein